MRSFQMETVLGRGSAQNCFDAPFGEVNPSHSVVFCVDHKQSLLVVDHQPLWPVEGCLERFSLITRVSFLAGAGDMVQFVRGSIDPPNTVAFAECNPNRFRVDRKRPWTKQRRSAHVCALGRECLFTCPADRLDFASGKINPP